MVAYTIKAFRSVVAISVCLAFLLIRPLLGGRGVGGEGGGRGNRSSRLDVLIGGSIDFEREKIVSSEGK